MAFRWPAKDGPLIVVFGSSKAPLINKQQQKNNVKVGPPLTKFSGSVHVIFSWATNNLGVTILKLIFIFQPKHTLWVLKRTVSVRWLFSAHIVHMFKLMDKEIIVILRSTFFLSVPKLVLQWRGGWGVGEYM